MTDTFESDRPGLISPATRHYLVTIESPGPATLDPLPRGLVALTDGNIEIIDVDGEAITYPVTAGDQLPFRAAALGSGTTATVAAWY